MDRVITVVAVLNNVPYVRYAVLGEVIVVALGSIQTNYVVLSTACDHYQVRSLALTVPLP